MRSPRLQDEITALNDEHLKAISVIDGKIDKISKSLHVLKNEKWTMGDAHRMQRDRLVSQRTFIENCLVYDSDKELTAAIDFFRGVQNRFRLSENVRAGGVYGASDEFLSPDADGRRKPFFNIKNYRQIDEILQYSKAALEELESMRILPEPDMGRVDALMAGIPSDSLDLDSFAIPKKTIGDLLFPKKRAA
jgi:hypothetical protein